MDMIAYGKFLAALAVVIGLIALCGWLARRLGLAPRVSAPRSGKRRLSLTETLAVDARHRLVLLRRDATEHLILLGPEGATRIESGIEVPAAMDEDDIAPGRPPGFPEAFGKVVSLMKERA